MRFIQLVHFDVAVLEARPLAERQEVDRRALQKNAELAESGHLVLTEALQGADTGVLVRVREGKVTVTDGPFIETKEQLAGFVLIEARDLAEAVAIAGDDPLADIGTIEVRAIYSIPRAAGAGVIDLEAIYRAERGRVLASLIRLLGGFDLAEEALAEAFLAAARQWPETGMPANPRAWLVSAGRFRAIDGLRRSGRFKALAPELRRMLDVEEETMPPEPETIADDTLRLIFVCCHPKLSPDAQLALTLREVCGLTTEAIAAAFLARPAAIAQRIVRAKTRIRDESLPYEVPEPADWPARLDLVLHTIYLIFNEGFDASSGDTLLRPDLCDEAVRLARLLHELHPGPDIEGLLGLLLLHQSRAPARTGPAGEIILLADQDRSLWDRGRIAEGTALAQGAFAVPPVGSYTIQAQIAATHAAAATAAATDWARIVWLYDLLARAEPSPIVALNRAVAIAMRDGPLAGLLLIDPLAAGDLSQYRFAHAARADLLRRLDRPAEARAAYREALALTAQAAERAFLERRLAELGD